MLKVRTSVVDRDMGFKKLAGDLGGAGTVTLGVQGKEAEQAHPNSELTVGQVAAIHELGLGVPERSWLRTWMDANQQRLRADMSAALQDVIRGRKSRKQAMADVAYVWVQELRENIRSGRIRPALAPSTAAAKGHAIPLLETGSVMNGITYRLFLNQIKGIKDAALRRAVRQGPQAALKAAKPKAKAKALRSQFRAGKKAHNPLWLYKLAKLAKRAFKKQRGGDGRNHGFKGVRLRGRTGLAGR